MQRPPGQLAEMSGKARDVLGAERLNVVADWGYFDSDEILACDRAGITVTLPKPMTSAATARGRYGKRDFRYLADQDVYLCPADQRLTYHYTNEKNGLTLQRYWTNVCPSCPIKDQCTAGKERRITRWEHEEVLEDRALYLAAFVASSCAMRDRSNANCSPRRRPGPCR